MLYSISQYAGWWCAEIFGRKQNVCKQNILCRDPSSKQTNIFEDLSKKQKQVPQSSAIQM